MKIEKTKNWVYIGAPNLERRNCTTLKVQTDIFFVIGVICVPLYSCHGKGRKGKRPKSVVWSGVSYLGTGSLGCLKQCGKNE